MITFHTLHSARLLGQREDEPAVAASGLEPDARVADLGRADQLLERHLMGLGEREEQLEAGLALAGFQSRQRALGDAGLRGELRSG